MSTVKYNSQTDRISIAESSREDDLIERDFKCVLTNRLWSLLSGQKLKGMIFTLSNLKWWSKIDIKNVKLSPKVPVYLFLVLSLAQ